jgi:hypothetical protein
MPAVGWGEGETLLPPSNSPVSAALGDLGSLDDFAKETFAFDAKWQGVQVAPSPPSFNVVVSQCEMLRQCPKLPQVAHPSCRFRMVFHCVTIMRLMFDLP